MKEYTLSEFLEAAKSFVKRPDAQEDMEKFLRETEAARQGIPAKDVVIVSEESICEVINSLTACATQFYIAIMSKFTTLGYKAIEVEKSEIPSYLAFDEHWNEFPEYAGYVPENTQWQSIKDEFYVLFSHSNDNPKFLILRKGEEKLSVYVYGFRVPYAPPVISLGTDAATRGRIAFCKTVNAKQRIVIAW